MAVFVVGALAAAGASAKAPEFGTCRGAVFGKYKDAGCTERAADRYNRNEGKYEWYTGKHFVRENGSIPSGGFEGATLEVHMGPTSFETESGKTISCAEGEGSYKLKTASKLFPGESWIEFSGCESEGKPCHGSAGYYGSALNSIWDYSYATIEEGLPDGLSGKLGYIKAPSETEAP
ncbi:MAG TPA: hypothetical protein VES65_02555, partial [Solirubrobacteraceae bacterium]|nr:hypothetical protein [Solirubrobacteraceae bacterium]